VTDGGQIDIGSLGSDFVEDAKVLRQLHDEDPAEFAKVAEQSGIGLRKAYYLVEIDRALEGYPVPKEKKHSIGWTKLQMISGHLNKKNYKVLLEQADAHPVHELEDVLAGKGLVENRHAMLFYFTPAEFEVLANIVVAHGGKRKGRSLKDKEAALTRALKKLLHDTGE